LESSNDKDTQQPQKKARKKQSRKKNNAKDANMEVRKSAYVPPHLRNRGAVTTAAKADPIRSVSATNESSVVSIHSKAGNVQLSP
jgi:hypothetical protein